MTPKALAACIELARKAASGNMSPESDVYWHTREACFELTRDQARSTGTALCFRWGQVLSCLKDLVLVNESELLDAAGDLWEHTMHPAILVDAVHNH